jgi:hypothetical protein
LNFEEKTMLLYLDAAGVYHCTQKDAAACGRHFEAVNVPIDHKGLRDFLNSRLMRHAQEEEEEEAFIAKPDAPKSYLDMTWVERLEAALSRPKNLRTAALYRGDPENYYIDCTENLLIKARSGQEFNEKQVNLASMIYDAAFRRANFRSLPDYEC